MKTLLLSALLAVGLSGCYAYVPARTMTVSAPAPVYGVVYDTLDYDGVEYFYDPGIAVYGGVAVYGLFSVDHYGHRVYHYVPRNHWHGAFTVRSRHH